MSTGHKKILQLIFLDRLHFKLLILFLSLGATLLGLSVPYAQKVFSAELSYNGLFICVLLSLAYLIFNQLTLFVGQNESVQAQKKLAELLYRHNLNLKPLTLQHKTTGEVVSLYTTDVTSVVVWLEQSLPHGLTTLFPLLLTPFFLFYFYDLPLTFSFLLVAVLVLINSLMAFRQSVFFFRFKVLAADRMGLVNEWIQNIRGLKILNWIEAFESKILKKRREETRNRIQMLTNGQVMNSISSSVMFWLNLALLGFLIWFYERPLLKEDIIALLWVTTVFLSRPMRLLPWFFTFVFDAWTSYKRLADFINLQNSAETFHSAKPDNSDYSLQVKNLSLNIGEKEILKNVSFSLKPNEMVALIGPVGAGKTMFIKSLLKETPFTADLHYSQTASYLPQEHFIMSASLRDNLNFDYQSGPEADERIMERLTQAQFNFELDRVHNGLDTIIGERGVNLSGGQKQRVSLARQLMNPQPLLILDDPLSAVDMATEKSMVTEFIKLKRAGHSLLITTQRFSVLPFCDRVIYMEKGQILFDGSSTAFLNDPAYQSFLNGLVQS